MDLTVNMNVLVVLFIYFTVATSQKYDDSVIIIGTGPSGIAAATKLIQNGITNIKMLEAQSRIGGRVYSTKFEDTMLDMGGQWVVGEKENVVYELAWPLGLLSHSKSKDREAEEPDTTFRIYGSSGEKLSCNVSTGIYTRVEDLTTTWPGIDDLKNGSMGEYLENQLNKIMDDYVEITPEMRKPLIDMMLLSEMANDGGEDIYKVSAKGIKDYKCCEGNLMINWKERTYGTILEILMKKYPNPEEELPVMDKVLLNKKVTKIKHNNNEQVEVTTSDGEEYKADHVIVTVSLGVLKANYESFVEPRMTPKRLNTILNLGMGHNAKIYLYYENPWWWTGEDIWVKSIFWTEADKKPIESDPARKWLLSIFTAVQIEYKPHVLCLWLAGPNIHEMEKLPEDQVMTEVKWLLQKFYGDSYNLTEPKSLIRSQWNTNENFLGAYSYRTLESDKMNARPEDLGEPIMHGDKPIVMFAGEATSPDKYGTVNGAIETGWREATRLINYCKSKSNK